MTPLLCNTYRFVISIMKTGRYLLVRLFGYCDMNNNCNNCAIYFHLYYWLLSHYFLHATLMFLDTAPGIKSISPLWEENSDSDITQIIRYHKKV